MKAASRKKLLRRIRRASIHLAVATAYAVLYLVLVQVSDGLWAITAGLRLSFLLLTPYRFWPALLVAEAVPLGFHLPEIARHSGWTAAWLCALPPIATGMPVVALFRRKGALVMERGAINAGALISCALSLSVVWAAINYAILWTAKAPPTEPVFHVNANQFLMMLVGQYAGFVTMLPIVLVTVLNYRPLPIQQTVNQLANSRLVTDMVLFLVPAIGLLFAVAPSCSPQVASVCQILMFAVLAMLTVKHGWAAAAVGSAGIIATIALTGPARACTGLMASQAVACFAVTCLLLLGADRDGGLYLLRPAGENTRSASTPYPTLAGRAP